ncbi:MAG: BatD family protein [Spirochaetales bacterium]|nr:BatD family protein [Spirochaetales bacterium]
MGIFSRERKITRYSKRLVIATLFVFFGSIGFAVDVSIDPNPVAQNSRFVLSFTFENFQGEFFDYTAPESDAFEVLGAPEFSYFSSDDVDVVKMNLKLSCRALKVGINILPPFSFETSLGSFKSEQLVLKVGRYSRGDIIVPQSAVWGYSFDSLFVGEARPVYIGLENLLEVPLVDNLVVENPYKAILSETTNFGLIERRQIGEYTLLNLPLVSYMLTPTSAGDMVLPRFRMSADGETVSGDSVKIQIKPIPKEIELTGAIGSFSYSYSVDNNRVYSDGRISILLTVSGEGNLNFLQIPEPVVEGFLFVDKIETMDIVPSRKGYTGSKSVRYVYVPDDVSQGAIVVPSFVWLSPSDSYSTKTQAGKKFVIDIMNRQRGEIIASQQKTVYQPKGVEEVLHHRRLSLFRQRWALLLFLPGIIVFFVVFGCFLRKKIKGKKRVVASSTILMLCFLLIPGIFFGQVDDIEEELTLPAISDIEDIVEVDVVEETVIEEFNFEQEFLDNLELGLSAYERGDFKESCGFFQKGLDYEPDNSFLAFNLSLASFQMGDVAQSIYFARYAIRKDPGRQEFVVFLHELEREYNLGNQLGSNVVLDPDIFLILLIVLSNIFLLLVSIWILKRNNWLVVVGVMLFLLVVGSGSGFFITKSNVDDWMEICKESSSLLNIPKSDSREIINLPAGTAVKVLGEAGSYLLVDTGYGLQGWINRTDLIR